MTRPAGADRRITEARRFLTDLGFDAERSNERSAYVVLALLSLDPTASWATSSAPRLGTLAIMRYIQVHYGLKYAANSRETIRRFTLYQFADELLVVQNPDRPDRPINSPKWCYQVEPTALELARAFDTEAYAAQLAAYRASRPGQVRRQAAERKMRRLQVRIGQQDYALSPGGQNELIVRMLGEFCPGFTLAGKFSMSASGREVARQRDGSASIARARDRPARQDARRGRLDA